jgi:hypothetical protein
VVRSISEELDDMHDPRYFNYGHGVLAVPEGHHESEYTDELSESEDSEESESSPRPSESLLAPRTRTTLHLLRALEIMALLLEILHVSSLVELIIASKLIERKCKSGQLNRRQMETHHGQIDGLRRGKPQNRMTNLNRTMFKVAPALDKKKKWRQTAKVKATADASQPKKPSGEPRVTRRITGSQSEDLPRRRSSQVAKEGNTETAKVKPAKPAASQKEKENGKTRAAESDRDSGQTHTQKRLASSKVASSKVAKDNLVGDAGSFQTQNGTRSTRAKTTKDASQSKKRSREEQFEGEDIQSEPVSRQSKAPSERFEKKRKRDMPREETTKDDSRPKKRSREERATHRSVHSRSEGDPETTAGSEARRRRRRRRGGDTLERMKTTQRLDEFQSSARVI